MDENKKDDDQQKNEGEVEKEGKGEIVNDDQTKQELERLQEEKEKLAIQRQEEDERVAQLTQDKKMIEEMGDDAKKTAAELQEGYEHQESNQKELVGERSMREMEVKEVSNKIETIKQAKGNDVPELKELEAKLNKLMEDDKEQDELEQEVKEKKEKLEKLIAEHEVSLSAIEAKRKEIDDEMLRLESQRRERELEEKRIQALIAQLRGEAVPGEEGLANAGSKSDGQKPAGNEVSRKGSFPLNDATAVDELREAGGKALVAAKTMRTLKDEIAGFLQKERLTGEDMKTLAMKQNELMVTLADLDEITRRIQYLMGLAEIATLELGSPKKLKFSLDYGEKPGVRTLSQLRPEIVLPQVVVCGSDLNYPQIIVCESSKYNTQNEMLQSRRFQSETSPSLSPQGRYQRADAQWANNYPGSRTDIFSPMRPEGRMIMESPYTFYRTDMVAPNQRQVAPFFGQSNVGMPVSSWLVTPGFGYTIGPSQATLGTGMPQRMMHPGMVQSASVGSFFRCPCTCPKKHKKWKKKKEVPQQAYSCPCVAKNKGLNNSGT